MPNETTKSFQSSNYSHAPHQYPNSKTYTIEQGRTQILILEKVKSCFKVNSIDMRQALTNSKLFRCPFGEKYKNFPAVLAENTIYKFKLY